MSYSKLKSLVANVEAIATAMKVRIDDRQATDEEKEVLSRYSGFGGIKDVLNIGTEHTSAMMWPSYPQAAGLDRRISLL